jgi:hypothetical protein
VAQTEAGKQVSDPLLDRCPHLLGVRAQFWAQADGKMGRSSLDYLEQLHPGGPVEDGGQRQRGYCDRALAVGDGKDEHIGGPSFHAQSGRRITAYARDRLH